MVRRQPVGRRGPTRGAIQHSFHDGSDAHHREMLNKERSAPRFPSVSAVVDGSEAIASVETRISEIALASEAIVPAPRHELAVVEVAI